MHHWQLLWVCIHWFVEIEVTLHGPPASPLELLLWLGALWLSVGGVCWSAAHLLLHSCSLHSYSDLTKKLRVHPQRAAAKVFSSKDAVKKQLQFLFSFARAALFLLQFKLSRRKNYQLCRIDLNCNKVLEDSLLKLRGNWVFLPMSMAAYIEVVHRLRVKGSVLFFLPNPYQNFYISCGESRCPFFLSIRLTVQFLHAHFCVQTVTYLRKVAIL